MNLYNVVLSIKEYCSICGCLLLQDKTPIEFTSFEDHFNEMFENDDLTPSACYCCLEGLNRPFLWLGQLPGYFVFPDGQIYSYSKRKIVIPYNRAGYPEIRVYSNEKTNRPGYKKYKRIALRVHKIVAMRYNPPIYYRGLVIRHLDDNKLNTHYKNLEWGTPAQNSADYKRNKKRKNIYV